VQPIAKTPIDWNEVFEYARQLDAQDPRHNGWRVMCQAIVESFNFQLNLLRQDLMNLKDEVVKVGSGEASDDRFHQLAERVEDYAKNILDATKTARPVAEMRMHAGRSRACYCGSPIRDGDFDCWTCPTCSRTTVVR
jgi:hypothetical protein